MDNLKIPLMSLKNISKCFLSASSKIEILKNAGFEIFHGEKIAIVGSSGIGKSTLLNIIGVLDKPDKGEILFQDTNVLTYDEKKMAGFRNTMIGFVFQFHYLLHGFTALENVMMPGRIADKNKKSIEKIAVNMLERVGLSKRTTHRVEDLSGGEQQRVALARALVMKPKLLLADEPTGNLDQYNSNCVHELINELNHELGMTVIVVTHNNDFARLMDRCVTLKEEKIVPA